MPAPSTRRQANTPLTRSERELSSLSWLILIVATLTPFLARYATFHSLAPPRFDRFFADVGLSPMNAAGFAACAVLFFLTRPTKDQRESYLVLAIVSEAFYLANLPYELDMLSRLLALGGGLGLAALLSLIYLSLFSPIPEQKARSRIYLRLALTLACYPLVTGGLLSVLSYLTPMAFDPYIYNVEGSLGFLPSFELAKFQDQHPIFTSFLLSLYSRLPLWIVLAFAVCQLYPQRSYTNIFSAFIFSGMAVFPLYYALPLIGIDDLLKSPIWPSGTPPETLLPGLIDADPSLPRTCIPSMHASWILIPYLGVRRISWQASIGYLFLAVSTILAALGPTIGHYLLDMIPAFPFTVAWLAFAAPASTPEVRRKKWVVFTVGNFLTLAYILGLRWGSTVLAAHGILFWLILCPALILTSLGLEHWLAREALPQEN